MSTSEYQHQYYLRTKELRKIKKRQHYLDNKEQYSIWAREWASNNPDKMIASRVKARGKQATRFSKWYQANRDKCRGRNALREATKKQRTPLWANISAIRDFYKNCPEGYHVDHIVPLHGKNVSGLHTLENLQYLPAIDNLRKGNKFTV